MVTFRGATVKYVSTQNLLRLINAKTQGLHVQLHYALAMHRDFCIGLMEDVLQSAKPKGAVSAWGHPSSLTPRLDRGDSLWSTQGLFPSTALIRKCLITQYCWWSHWGAQSPSFLSDIQGLYWVSLTLSPSTVAELLKTVWWGKSHPYNT